MTIIVYNPNYIHPNEIARLLRECEDKGILATTVTHHNTNQKPLYIQTVERDK
jgi:hypothetical protein